MMINNQKNERTNNQDLHHLIAVSTGFIDVYVIDCHAKPAMLVPQNIVLSALDSKTNVKMLDWHDHQLPVFHINTPDWLMGVALVIEGEDKRFALMCNSMPKAIRIRISELIDDVMTIEDQSIKQYVRMHSKLFHIPNIAYIQSQLS